MSCRSTRVIGVLFLVWLFSISSFKASAAGWTVRAQPTRLVNGGPILFQVKTPVRLDSLSGSWLGHERALRFDASSRTWYALAGVSLGNAPRVFSPGLSRE